MMLFSSIFILIVILFFCWHFLFSIYEVKFKHNFPDKRLLVDNSYEIKCIGLNSIGWEITYRNLDCNFIVQSGSDLIKINNSKDANQFNFKTLATGELVIEVNSHYSFNPTRYKLIIAEQ